MEGLAVCLDLVLLHVLHQVAVHIAGAAQGTRHWTTENTSELYHINS